MMLKKVSLYQKILLTARQDFKKFTFAIFLSNLNMRLKFVKLQQCAAAAFAEAQNAETLTRVSCAHAYWTPLHKSLFSSLLDF